MNSPKTSFYTGTNQINGNTVFVRTAIVVSYDAEDAVLQRIIKRGGIFDQAHCVRVGKVARIFYWKPTKEVK